MSFDPKAATLQLFTDAILGQLAAHSDGRAYGWHLIEMGRLPDAVIMTWQTETELRGYRDQGYDEVVHGPRRVRVEVWAE